MKTRFLPFIAATLGVVGGGAGSPWRIAWRRMITMTMTVAGLASVLGGKAVAADLPARAPVSPASSESARYQQRAYPPQANLLTPEVAAAIQERFRTAYPKLGQPRFLLHVNRQLVDSRSGLRVVGRDETVVQTRRDAALEVNGRLPAEAGKAFAEGPTSASTGSGAGLESLKADLSGTGERVTTVNRYERLEPRQQTVEQQQTVREMERRIGRRLRLAGATLADQGVATALIADRPLRDVVAATEGEQARKDREALVRIADVAIEVLILEREVTVQRVSGDQVLARPEIQLTAIRLSDARILGQATSGEGLGSGPAAAQRLLRYSLGEIADATVLRLMDDMMLGFGVGLDGK